MPSRVLLALYCVGLSLALLACLTCGIPAWLRLLGAGACLVHAGWVLPRQVLLSHPRAFRALRHDGGGWQLWSSAQGWQPVQLLPDSLALPWAVVLRVRSQGRRRACGLCIMRDALDRDTHRRLRVRLRFSRDRWAAPG